MPNEIEPVDHTAGSLNACAHQHSERALIAIRALAAGSRTRSRSDTVLAPKA